MIPAPAANNPSARGKILATAPSSAGAHTLLVDFDNGQRRRYDVSPLLKMEMFAPLENIALFRAVKVECRGWAVSWSDEIDISNQELWANGESGI